MRHRPIRFDALEDRALLATITVNSTADASPPASAMTLRLAIEVADGAVAPSSLSTQQQAQITGSLASTPDVINFNIPGSGVHTIQPTAVMPTVTVPVVINGYSQPGASQNTLAIGDNAKLLIAINGSMAGSDIGLTLSGGHSVVEGLAINGFQSADPSNPGGEGLWFVNSPGGNFAWGNFIGTDATGMIGVPNSNYGVVFSHEGSGDTLGGTQPGARNIVQTGDVGTAQQFGVGLDHISNAYVLGNYLGTNATGLGVPSGQGSANANALSLNELTIGCHVGGAAPGAGNVIEGLYIKGGTTLANGYNVIQGNLIGTDVTGKHPLGGQNYGGMTVKNSIGNVIGGSVPGAGNLIGATAGMSSLYLVTSNPAAIEGTVLEGNRIDIDPTGTTTFGDYDGIYVGSSGNAIGDIVPGSGNIITGAIYDGVHFASGVTNNKILNNQIYGNGGAQISSSDTSSVTAASITSAYPVSQGLLIQGGSFAQGAPNTPYTVQFFTTPSVNAAGDGEARVYLGTITVVTNGNGNGSFRWLLPVGVSPGAYLTASVTGPTGNTTVFAHAVAISPEPTDSLAFQPVPTAVSSGSPVGLVAQLFRSTSDPGNPTGTVTFRDGATIIAVVNVSATGQAVFVLPSLSRGVHRLSAIYSGDSISTGAFSSVVNVTVS